MYATIRFYGAVESTH